MWSQWLKHGGDGVPVLDGTDVKVWYDGGTQAILHIDQSTWRDTGSSWHWGSTKLDGEKWKRILYYQVWNHPVALSATQRRLLEVYK